MQTVFIIGTAGSGKSLLTASLSQWLRSQGCDVAILNLDPGALTLPYTPDVDIREYIRVEDIMRRYGLGPNGALIMAADLIASQINEIKDDIESCNPDMLIVDTPGQMELFAFRASGPFIINGLTNEPKAIIYLFDAVFSLNPLNYISNMFLAAAVYHRFLVPQIHVLSKCDLIPKDKIKCIIKWSSKAGCLEEAINKELEGMKRVLSRDIMMAIRRLELCFSLIPVSAKTYEGFLNLNMILERVLSGGEKLAF